MTADAQNILFSLIMGVVCAPIGYYIGKRTGRGLLGACLGFALGIIGLAIIAFFRRPRTQPGAYQAPPPAAAPPAATPPPARPGALVTVGPQWALDPTGRFEYRFWNGTAWTEHVRGDGIEAIDELRPRP